MCNFEVFSLGPDPFYTAPVPPTPTPTPNTKDNSAIWIIILVVIIVLLLGLLGWAVYNWRVSQAEAEAKRGIIYNDEEAAKTALTNSEEI